MIKHKIDTRFACKPSKLKETYASGRRVTRAQIPNLIGTVDLTQPNGIRYVGKDI